MKTLAAGLMTCALIQMVSCSKVDDSKEGGRAAPNAPSADSLVPGFKNTAKSGSEVGDKLKSFASEAKKTNFVSGSSSSTLSLADTSVSSFLNSKALSTAQGLTLSDSDPSDSNVLDALMDIEMNDDCGAAVKKLSTLYDKKYSEIRDNAAMAIEYDGKLPSGVAKGPATDQYAASYILTGKDDNGRPAAGGIGFGSNAEKAVVGLSLDMQMEDPSDEKTITSVHMETIHVVTIGTKTIEESMNLSTNSGLTMKESIITVGGDRPSVTIKQEVSKGAETALGNITVSKLSDKLIEIQGSQTIKGSETKKSLKLSIDSNGSCISSKK